MMILARFYRQIMQLGPKILPIGEGILIAVGLHTAAQLK